MLAAFLVLFPPQTCEVTFVRHAETVANATGRYNSRTLNVFSDLGNQQVKALTDRLVAGKPFDTILVSPSERALRTIGPYLRATGQKAIVWPLLYECCTGRRKGAVATRFGYSGKVSIPPGLGGLFTIIPGSDRLPNSPTYGAGLAQVAECLKVFRAKYAKGRVLVVGHSGHGGHFWYGLTGNRRQVKNAEEMTTRLR